MYERKVVLIRNHLNEQKISFGFDDKRKRRNKCLLLWLNGNVRRYGVVEASRSVCNQHLMIV